MSDLSNLLGSVYGDRNPDAAPVQHERPADDRGPAWDDDARLDEAFQHWTPGPGPDAPAHEREMLGGSSSVEIPQPADPDRDLAAALSAALAAETRSEPGPVQPPTPTMSHDPGPYGEPVPAQPHEPAPVHAVPAMPTMAKEQAFVAPAVAPTMAPPAVAVAWQFGDDDIYPRGRKAKKGKR